MAERKAVNKYYPPDWDPRKGSANKRVGQHPLRDRAKKLSQGILVIRFELPYNIWCGGCGSHVGMGVRYNAEKTKVGNYYSTPIYKFRMKCHLCDNYFEIQTDPKNHDYVILCGARRKEQRWDPVANEQVVPEDKNTQKKLATDAMFKLEHGSNDQQKGAEKTQSLAVLEESKISMQDDYILNRMARDQFRAEKKQLKDAMDADNAILKKNALDISLVEETEEDIKLATLMKYSVTTSFEEKQKEKRKSIELRPLFEGPSSVSSKGKELKYKLGKVLEASYKDPFHISLKKKMPGFKATNPSLVLVKKNKIVALKKETPKGNSKVKVPGLSGRSIHDVSGTEAILNAVSDIAKTHNTGSEATYNATSGSEATLNVPQTSKLNETDSVIVSDLKDQLSGMSSCQDHLTVEQSRVIFSDESPLTLHEICNVHEATDSTLKTLNHGPNQSLEKSGLFSLMTSYADSDSDSTLSVT
ncbi:coiled-coil domain-containing protein 130 [Biomphalaria glabrata]|nr:coiled-coil domain-containing protein 130-like [Biomphalaria glabrata]